MKGNSVSKAKLAEHVRAENSGPESRRYEDNINRTEQVPDGGAHAREHTGDR